MVLSPGSEDSVMSDENPMTDDATKKKHQGAAEGRRPADRERYPRGEVVVDGVVYQMTDYRGLMAEFRDTLNQAPKP